MQHKSAKQKGKSGENEICIILNTRFELDAERQYNQASGGADVYELGMAIEVKRHEKLHINDWWEQVIKASELTGRIPVLAYRQNRQKWTFCLCGNLIGLSPLARISLTEKDWLDWVELHFQYLSDLEASFR